MPASNPMNSYHSETLAVRGGEKPDSLTGALAPSLVRTKTYRQQFGVKSKWEYSRGQNPTRAHLEEKLAALEGSGFATAFASGLAAETMLFLTLPVNSNIVIPKEVYGGTLRLLKNVFVPYTISYTQADFSKEKSLRKAVAPNTRYFFIESLTNPSLVPIDLSLVQHVSQTTGIPFIADVTFTPPCTTRAFDYNAYAVVHSLSKYLSGHNDVLGGAVITQDRSLHERLQFLQKTVGAVLSPDECYRCIQGIKTLPLRWKQSSESAQTIAEHLSIHSKIQRVLYPGLPQHPGHNIARKQMRNGYGGVLSFELATEQPEKVAAFVEKAQVSGVITYAESLASPETLLAYPYTMSHGSLSSDEKQALGISRSFFRFSIGFEHPSDIISALEEGLAQV